MNDATPPTDATTRRLDTAALELLAANAKTIGVAAPVSGALNLERTGDWIGRYRLIEELGEGGFGVVWRAEQTEPIHREVALKVIRPGMDSREIIARFAAEQQALALMDHPNIAAVLDAGTTDSGRPYFVMELVKGVPITTYCDERKLTIRQRLELFIPVCQAVQHAHQKAILHRDLKPSNILVMEVDGKPVPKVIDFGIAKALGTSGELALQASLMRTQEGMVIGTPQYMSPEQAGSMPDVDTRSDIYTLGVILYELLTGNTPIPLDQLKQAALDQVLRLIREGDTKRPSSSLLPLSEAVKLHATDRSSDPKKISAILRGDIDWIVLKALEKERERRYDSANALAEDIQHHLQNEPVNAGPPSAAYRFRKLVQRNKLLVAASAAVLVCLLAGVAATGYALLLEQRARKQAVENEAHAQSMLREASRSDYATAHEHLGKGEWSKGVAYLGRSVRYDPANRMARGALWQTLMNGQSDAEKLPIHSLEHPDEVTIASFSPDGTRIVTSSHNKKARLWDTKAGQPIGHAMAHASTVYSAVFSPDGTRLVTGSDDKTARLWNALNGQPLGSAMEHTNAVNAVFSPDGTRVLTMSNDKTARLWDGQTGRPIGTPMQIRNGWRCASFSPDGTRIVTISGDLTARVWDGKTGRSLDLVMGHSGVINRAIFSPDGTQILTASDDKTARLWDARTAKAVGPVMEHKGKVGGVFFSLDSSRLITVSDYKTVRLWDSATCQPIGAPMEHEHPVSTVSFSPDDTRFLTAEDLGFEWSGRARLWDTKTGQPIGNAMVHAGGISNAVFSPDGIRVLTASSDKTARQWDAATGQPMGLPLAHEHWVIRATYNQDGTRILTACGDDFDRNHGSAKIWDAATTQPMDTAISHASSVRIANFSPDGTRLITGSHDRTARLWDARTGLPLGREMPHSEAISSAVFNPKGTLVLTASPDKTARLWDGVSGETVGKIMSHDGPINSTAFSPDGNYVLTASDDKTARLWDGKTGEFLGVSLHHADRMLCANFSPDSKRVVTGSNDKTARLWHVKTGKPFGEIMTHHSGVIDVGFSPDGSRIVTATTDFFKTVQLLWDAKTGTPVGAAMNIKDVVSSARFSPDGQRVVTATGRVDAAGAARLWNAQTGQPIGAIMPHKKLVEVACFSPDGALVATSGYEAAARLWDGTTGQTFGAAMSGAVWSVNFSPDGKRLVGSGARDGTARLWEINTDQLLESAVAENVAAFCSGMRLDAALGTLIRLTPAERMAIWAKNREALSAPESSDWRFAVERHLPVSNPDALCSPRMTVTRHEMLERMILSRTPELVREALAIDPRNPLLPYALAEIEDRAEDKTGAAAIRAQFLRDYGHKRLSAELAKNPRSAAGYVAMARSHRFALDLGRKDIAWSGADKRQQHCIVLWQHLVEAMPENTEWQMELAGSLHLAGQMQQAQNHPAEAEGYFLKALEIMERLKKSRQRPAQDTLEDAILKSLDLVRKGQAELPTGGSKTGTPPNAADPKVK